MSTDCDPGIIMPDRNPIRRDSKPAPAADYQFAGTKGVGKAKLWKGKIKSIHSLVRWLAKQPDSHGLYSKLEIQQSVLDSFARMYEKGLAEQIPGLEAEEVEQRRTRT